MPHLTIPTDPASNVVILFILAVGISIIGALFIIQISAAMVNNWTLGKHADKVQQRLDKAERRLSWLRVQRFAQSQKEVSRSHK